MQKTDFTISESFVLPSKGKIYEQNIPESLTLRSMTTQEEMKRLSHSDSPYKNLCDIIDDCIVENIPISSYDMCFADYQFLLYSLRTVTYGKDYNLVTKCPYCGSMNAEKLDMSVLPIKYIDSEGVDVYKYLKYTLPQSKMEVELNFQTPRMIDRANYNAKEAKKKSSTAYDQTPLFMVQELIKTIDRESPNQILLPTIIRKLPMMDTNIMLALAEKFNMEMGIDNSVEILCDYCGIDFKSALRTDREFFRPTI